MTKSRDLADNSQNTKPKVVINKGDLIVGTQQNSADRLGVGSNGYTLVADSSTSTGLAYSGTTNGNPVINGGMDIWQRGTSFSTGNLYTADRWKAACDAGTFTVSRSTDAPTGFTYSLSFAGTSTTSPQITSFIESVNSTYFAGQTITLSIYVKSTVGTSNLGFVTYFPTTTDDFSTANQDASGILSASPAGSWTRYSATFTASANANRGYRILFYRGGTAVNTTTLYTGVQIDLGSTALPFRRSGNTIQGELTACQRYYQRYSQTVAVAQLVPNASALSTTAVDFGFPTQVTFRVKPGSLETVNVGVYQFSNATTYSNGTWSIPNDYGNPNIPLLRYTHGSAVFTANNVCGLVSTSGSNAGYIGLSAEL